MWPRIEVLGRPSPGVVNMPSMTRGSSRVSCSERTLSISDTYAIPAEIFPKDLNYVALGHVHQPQTVAAPLKTCYAGSLRPLDFLSYQPVLSLGPHVFFPVRTEVIDADDGVRRMAHTAEPYYT